MSGVLAGVVAPFGKFEGQQNATADFDRVLDSLQAGGESFPFVVAEIGVAGSGGDNEGIVRNCLSFIFRYGLHHAAFEVEARHLSHEHFDVFVAVQDGADRSGNLAGRETGGGYLIEQRLEGVMIFAVDHGDAYGRAGQRLGRAEAAEAGAHDHDALCCLADHFLADRSLTDRSLAARSLAAQAPTLYDSPRWQSAP